MTAATAPIAAFFDLDKTVIARSSAIAFFKPLYEQGLMNRRSVLKSSYAQFIYLLTAADADQVSRLRNHVTEMAAGWNVEQVRGVVEETSRMWSRPSSSPRPPSSSPGIKPRATTW